MVRILEYREFVEELEETVYKSKKSDLINKVAANPNRYVGIFRPTNPELKLVQNITQSHEISFRDFIENIITTYLGKYYKNLPKRATYNNETILFDQLFEYDDKIFMIEQKLRDDHDSTKKRGQFQNFIKKIKYLTETYPNKEIEAGMWFVDQSLIKNKKYYLEQMQKNSNDKVHLHLFYGNEFTDYIDKIAIWDELEEYLIKWKMSEDNKIELNFEENWEETKKELLEKVPKSSWIKIMKNDLVVKEILPILFPASKYKEILDDLDIKY